MGIHHEKDRNIIYITQQQYIEESVKVFSKYGISEYRAPMDDRAVEWDYATSLRNAIN